MFSVLSSYQKKHNRPFACLDLVLFSVHFWRFSLVFVLVGLSFPIKKQNPKPWNSEKCNINLENQIFS